MKRSKLNDEKHKKSCILKRGIFLALCLVLTGCLPKKSFYRRKAFLKRTCYIAPLTEGPTTIFVHGTKTSLISRLVHQCDYPEGVIASRHTQTRSVMTNIGYTLSATDPVAFPRDSFYYYTWPGKLSFASRLRAAEKLYSIAHEHKGPLTIITHSHGCNVALNLAYWAEKNNDSLFVVDKLILLAPPVQEVTKQYTVSPVFKRIYSLYSSADVMQVSDPQALYWESYAYSKPVTNIPLFSRRTFEPAPHIIQVRILLDWQSPGHLNFLLHRFLKNLSAIINLVTCEADNGGYERCGNCYTVNIPLLGLSPHLVDPKMLKGKYIPRDSYYKTKRGLRPKKNN